MIRKPAAYSELRALDVPFVPPRICEINIPGAISTVPGQSQHHLLPEISLSHFNQC